MARKLSAREKRNRAIVRRQKKYLAELNKKLGYDASVELPDSLTNRQKIAALDKEIARAKREIKEKPEVIPTGPEQPEPEELPEVLLDIWDNEVVEGDPFAYDREHLRVAGFTFGAAMNYQQEIPIPTLMFVDPDGIYRLVVGDSGGIPQPNEPFTPTMIRRKRPDTRRRKGDRHKDKHRKRKSRKR